jgi:hypothetical protein
MDLLTSSGSSVTAAAAGKAVGTWAAWRPFGGVDNGRFLLQWAPLDAVAEFSAPTITLVLSLVFSVRGHNGFGREQEGGEKKCP